MLIFYHDDKKFKNPSKIPHGLISPYWNCNLNLISSIPKCNAAIGQSIITGSGSDTFVWDWKNRLISSVVGSNSNYYGYDHNNIRVIKGDGTATTTIPNMYYDISSATTTKHIYLPDGTLIATVESNGTSTTTQYAHLDHLGSTNVMTDENGDVVQTLDYYPYGELRIDDTTDFDETKKFTGHEFDRDSNLTYAKQRYYNQDIGKWLSQDPVFLNVGIDRRTQKVLEDPQLANAYSYGRNNPVVSVDKEGEFIDRVITSGFGSWIGIGSQYVGDLSLNMQDIRNNKSDLTFKNLLQPRSSLQAYSDASMKGLFTGAITGLTVDPATVGVASFTADIGVDLINGRSINFSGAIESLLSGTISSFFVPNLGISNNYLESVSGDAVRQTIDSASRNISIPNSPKVNSNNDKEKSK